jgi:hypothetical protein
MLPAKKTRAYEGPECPRCTSTLPMGGVSGPSRCGACGRDFDAAWFAPIAVAGPAPTRVGSAGPDGSIPCAWHAGNVAEVACARCGSFICGLCRVDVEKRTLCTACFDRQTADGSLTSTVLNTRDWATSARTMALLGLVIPWLGLLLGPAAIYYAIRGRRAKLAANEGNEMSGLNWMIGLGAFDALYGVFVCVATIVGATAAP